MSIPPSPGDLAQAPRNRTAVVTGGSRGIGRALCVELAAHGAFVHVGYRTREDEALRTLEALSSAGGQGAILCLDVRDPSSVREAFRGVHAAHGGIDILVNNAAVTRDNLFVLLRDEDWAEVLDVNVRGVVACCRAAVPFMLRSGAGVIVNVASVAGLRASPGQANYSASKGAILAFTRTLAAELAPKGIRVNAVVPGLIDAGMGAVLDHRIAAERRAQIPLGRFGHAEEVARAVRFLASEEASYVVGEALVVDGGLSL